MDIDLRRGKTGFHPTRLKWRGCEWTPPRLLAQMAGLREDTTPGPLRISINAKVTWIPRESVDRLVARVCVDVIRKASE